MNANMIEENEEMEKHEAIHKLYQQVTGCNTCTATRRPDSLLSGTHRCVKVGLWSLETLCTQFSLPTLPSRLSPWSLSPPTQLMFPVYFCHRAVSWHSLSIFSVLLILYLSHFSSFPPFSHLHLTILATLHQ